MDDTQTTRSAGTGTTPGRRCRRRDATYRLAVERTLDQLEWVVHYLRGIGKTGIAEALDKNRRQIHGR